MSLPDEIRAAQETLSDLWEAVTDSKSLAENDSELDVLSEVGMWVDDAQDCLEEALGRLGSTP